MAMEESQLAAEQHEQFVVDSKEKAAWAIRKLAKIYKEMAENDKVAQAEIDRIKQWLEEENSRLQKDAEYFEHLLIDYHQKVLVDDPKAKTIRLPYGTLKSITRKPSPKKVDVESLLMHLKQSGETEYIVVKEEPAWAEYKKTLRVCEVDGNLQVVDQNGEQVPGVIVDAGGTTFKVEVDA